MEPAHSAVLALLTHFQMSPASSVVKARQDLHLLEEIPIINTLKGEHAPGCVVSQKFFFSNTVLQIQMIQIYTMIHFPSTAFRDGKLIRAEAMPSHLFVLHLANYPDLGLWELW